MADYINPEDREPLEATQDLADWLPQLIITMRNKLYEGRYKPTFRRATLQYLSMRLTQEKKELVRAVQRGSPAEEVLREAADVANFAAMIAYNYKCDGHPPNPPND